MGSTPDAVQHHESEESEEENMEDPSLTTSSSNGELPPARSVWHSCPPSIKQAKPSNIFGKTIDVEKSEGPRVILPPGFELDDELDIQFGNFASTSSSEKKNESSLDTKEAPPKPKMVTIQNILNPNPRGGIISSKIAKIGRTVHKTGVFGAYVCNDPKAFTTLAAANHLGVNKHELKMHHGLSTEQWREAASDPRFELSLTCFNWETVSEICKVGESSEEKYCQKLCPESISPSSKIDF